MASPHEAQTPPSASLDPQHFQFQSNDPPAFNSMIAPSRPDVTIPTNSTAQVHAPMSSLFQPEMDPMPVSMQMSLNALPPRSTDMSAMDVVSAAPAESTPSQALLPEFSAQNGSFRVDTRLTGLDGLDGSHHLASSPSATSVSTNPSHTSSPAMNGMTSTYSVASSSLASALDSMAATRSRSGSSASPPNFMSSSSDLGFPSSGSGPPTSAHESGFQFSLPGFDNPPHPAPAKESSPEVPGGAHLMVLGDMLKNIARTANSGSEACTMGQTTDAQHFVDLLKKNVLLVADLVAAMQLADGSVAGLDVGQQPHLNGLASFASSPGSLDPNAMLDTSDMSRKRCASSIAGDRVLKVMKLEPQDDAPPLQIPTSSAMHPPAPPPVLTSPVFPFTQPMSSIPSTMSTMSDIPSVATAVPPPVPSSRPPSSSGVTTHHPLDLLSESQPSVLHFPPHLDHVHPVPHPVTDFSSPTATTNVAPPTLPSSGFNPSLSNNMWTDGPVPITRHHSHSFSAGSVFPAIPEASVGPLSLQYPPSSAYGSPTRATQIQPPVSVTSSSSSVNVASHPPARTSRSSSMSNLHPHPFAHVLSDIVPSSNAYEALQSRPSTSGRYSPRASSPEYDDDMDAGNDSDSDDDHCHGYMYGRGIGDGSDNSGSGEGSSATVSHSSLSQRRMSRTSPSAEGGASGHGNEVPQEYRAEVERIFFEFLNSICSNLDATDAKGEPIHQTLMAKKMQRLDESPDFRPFKFRIQAFTNAFLEELARQDYPEEKIPMKKIRNFLWNQPYISRFNEEGKKSKSKGNHIWHVDAKKSEGGWAFRPFRRKLAGTPPGVAYIGLRWSWTPRIWDPQASRTNTPVKYSSPLLPSWLSWKDDVLAGTPTPDAQSCDVTVEARFMQEGKEELLTHTVHITIAPMASVDSTFTPSRRPSLVDDVHNARRVLSDSVVAQTTPPRLLRAQSSLAPVVPVVAPDSQVVQVLTTAAQRVAQEAQSQVVASPNDAGPELQALAKQQHVLTVTAQAFNSKLSGEILDGSAAQSNALTAAAQQVVLQAARQVAADRAVGAAPSGIPPSQVAGPQVTVKDVSVATQSAVAQAVDMVGPLSSEVDVLMTASSLLQQQTRAPLPPPPPILDTQLAVVTDPSRPHSSGTSPPGQFGMPVVVPPLGTAFFSTS
ncbi:hypothetical protein AcW2_004628 [Taiwanofungus camphoratus]|nr:hypothetical protein AcW2_004628 [Antrodia cinnamomea]